MEQIKGVNILDIGHSIQMTGALYSGNGKHFLCIFPDEHGHYSAGNAEILEMSHPEWEKFLAQTDHLEVEMRLMDPTTGQIVKAITRKSQRQVDQNISWAVFRRDGYSCRYCGKNNVPLTVDHLVLWEEGGPSTEANLVSACKKCNRTRGNMQYDEWLDSPYYRRVSQAPAALSHAQRLANEALVPTLASIPRVTYKRSR